MFSLLPPSSSGSNFPEYPHRRSLISDLLQQFSLPSFHPLISIARLIGSLRCLCYIFVGQLAGFSGLRPVLRPVCTPDQRRCPVQATEFRDANIVDVSTYEELKAAVAGGKWARGGWSGSDEDEKRVKEETQATLRCFPFDQPEGPHVCFLTREPADRVALFAKAY